MEILSHHHAPPKIAGLLPIITVLESSNQFLAIINRQGQYTWQSQSFQKLISQIGKSVTTLPDLLALDKSLKYTFTSLISKETNRFQLQVLRQHFQGVITNLESEDQFLLSFEDLTKSSIQEQKLKKAVEQSERNQIELKRAIQDQEELNRNLMLAELKYKSAFKQEKNIFDALEKTKSELQEARNQLANQDKLATIGLLTAGIAHELNNPVNFISNGINAITTLFEELKEFNEAQEKTLEAELSEAGKTQLANLREEYEYEETLEDLQAMIVDVNTGAKRTIEIIKGLRVFSRTDENERVQTSVNELIDSTLILLKSKLKGRVNVICDYQKDMSDLECYPGPLNQVLMNLISNSAQAIPEDRKDGQIVITTVDDGRNQSITIKDNGSGIPKSLRTKIFQPFFTTKKVGEGTGLGMSISRDIIEGKHAGKLSFDSEEGLGTTFTISLPKVV